MTSTNLPNGNTIFLSYSSQDYFFAEMLDLKLTEGGFKVWRDLGCIRAGDDWRQSIEAGIETCTAVVVALSANSANSAYVTYEWAYALGMGIAVIPVKLSDCKIHPKLEPVQYFDFSYPKSLPWNELIQRLKGIEDEKPPASIGKAMPAGIDMAELDVVENAVLEYLTKSGYTKASFERLKDRIKPGITDDMLNAVIENRPDVFRHAVIKGGQPGIAKRVP